MHPLGHGRPTYFWSFIVALLLFSIGGVASIYEGLRNVAVKAQMRDTANSRELMQVIRDSEAGLKAEFPQVRWVFFEPVAASDSADS